MSSLYHYGLIEEQHLIEEKGLEDLESKIRTNTLDRDIIDGMRGIPSAGLSSVVGIGKYLLDKPIVVYRSLAKAWNLMINDKSENNQLKLLIKKMTISIMKDQKKLEFMEDIINYIGEEHETYYKINSDNIEKILTIIISGVIEHPGAVSITKKGQSLYKKIYENSELNIEYSENMTVDDINDLRKEFVVLLRNLNLIIDQSTKTISTSKDKPTSKIFNDSISNIEYSLKREFKESFPDESIYNEVFNKIHNLPTTYTKNNVIQKPTDVLSTPRNVIIDKEEDVETVIAKINQVFTSNSNQAIKDVAKTFTYKKMLEDALKITPDDELEFDDDSKPDEVKNNVVDNSINEKFNKLLINDSLTDEIVNNLDITTVRERVDIIKKHNSKMGKELNILISNIAKEEENKDEDGFKYYNGGYGELKSIKEEFITKLSNIEENNPEYLKINKKIKSIDNALKEKMNKVVNTYNEYLETHKSEILNLLEGFK